MWIIYYFIFTYQVKIMKKKILIVSDYLDNIGGIETYIKNLKYILLDDYEVYYFWAKNLSKVKKLMFLIFSWNNFIYAKKLKDKIEEIKPDIIWFHSVSRFLWSKVVEQVKDFKWLKLMTYHDLWYFSLFASEIYEEKQIPKKFNLIEFLKKSKKWKKLLPYSILKYLKLKKLRKVLNKYIDIHTVPSNFMKNYVQLLWYGWENVKVLPNFVDSNHLIERQDIFQDKINFIFFGRLDTEKWFWQIIYFLSYLQDLKFTDRKLYTKIMKNIRIFIFWDWEKKESLLDTFQWEDIIWKDIWIINDYSSKKDLLWLIDQNNKNIYYFWKRNFDEIKYFLSFSHYNLVPSLFLETFWLSAVEWAINWLINIWYDKENITNFILQDFKINFERSTKNFIYKLLKIINNHNIDERKKNSLESKKLVSEFVIK